MALYSKSVQNAVTILTFIARRGGGAPITVNEIAKETGVSGPTGAKRVQPLVKRGVLSSCKGPGGGFVLALSAKEICLGAIVMAVEGREPFGECMAGLTSCSEDNICPLHDRWKGVKMALLEFMEKTKLEDMVCAVEQMIEEKNQLDSEKKIDSGIQNFFEI